MTSSAPPRTDLSTSTLALAAMRCRPGAPRLGHDELAAHVGNLPGWTAAGEALGKTFAFDGYAATIAFVNAVAFIAQHEDHHPDLLVRYGDCKVTCTTHDAGGVTLNDVICAAKIERLLA